MNTLRNQVQLIGNLGNDPEIITYDNNKKMAKISLATNESYTNAKGEKIENTQWHKVVFFGKTVGIVEKYLQKGKKFWSAEKSPIVNIQIKKAIRDTALR